MAQAANACPLCITANNEKMRLLDTESVWSVRAARLEIYVCMYYLRFGETGPIGR
jgi:hypothetical protein